MTIEEGLASRLVTLRRDLHRRPEVGWDVERTATRIVSELGDLGITARRVAETAVVADLPAVGVGPGVALRADMDALPIQERTGQSFASEAPGIMHACGHDGHASALVGAAALLVTTPLPAPVRLIFQPAEEIAEGARRLIEAGCLEGITAIHGLHLDVGLPVGVIGAPDGTVNASSDEFAVELSGSGGHAARPHEGTDAVVGAGLLIAALQTVVARRVPPSEPAVVTVGRLIAGTAPNVLAETARLEGTVRATTPQVRALLRSAIEHLARATAAAHGLDVSVTVRAGTPPVINEPQPTALARRAAAEVVGAGGVRTAPLHNMGGEDFGYYLEHVSGSFVRIGARIDDGEERPAHSSRFDFDERALGIAAAYLATVARFAGGSVRAHPF